MNFLFSRLCKIAQAPRAPNLQTISSCIWTVAPLSNKGIIKVSGADAASFLQGLITADIYSIEDPRPSVYAMVLNVQGRVLYDVIIYKMPLTAPGTVDYCIEVDSTIRDGLMNHLKQYRIRKKVDISDVTGSRKVWAAFGEVGKSKFSAGLEHTVLANSDPRLKELGWRLLAPASTKVTDEIEGAQLGTCDDYEILRYELGVGEGPVDHPPGKALPLECNLVYLNGVSFSKGCYIGQELTARTHHTGVIRKRLMPIRFESDSAARAAAFDDDIRDEQGASVGKFRRAVGNRGLALLRHEAALRKGAELSVVAAGGQRLRVLASRPSWWQISDVGGKDFVSF